MLQNSFCIESLVINTCFHFYFLSYVVYYWVFNLKEASSLSSLHIFVKLRVRDKIMWKMSIQLMVEWGGLFIACTFEFYQSMMSIGFWTRLCNRMLFIKMRLTVKEHVFMIEGMSVKGRNLKRKHHWNVCYSEVS